MPELTYSLDNSLITEHGFLRNPDGNIYYSEDYHTYILPSKGIGDNNGNQRLQFIHGIPDIDPSKPMEYIPGVSDEQLLEVLINRSEYFQRILRCQENVVALDHLKAALQAKLDRTAKRQVKGIEGTMLNH